MERRTDDDNLATGYEHVHNYGVEIVGGLISLETGVDDVVLQAVIYDNPIRVSTTHRRAKALSRQTCSVTTHDIGSRPVVSRGLREQPLLQYLVFLDSAFQNLQKVNALL